MKHKLFIYLSKEIEMINHVNYNDIFYYTIVRLYSALVNPKDIEYKQLIKEDNTNLLEVSYTGFGFMLIKKGVFESLEYPWFRPLWKEIDGNIHEFMSEDVSICELFKKKNYKIYVNTNVVIGHEKSLIIN